jgi:hypothetical protein
MRAGETELVMATRHVAEQEGRIVRQEFLVTHLQAVEAPLDDALDLLASMYDLLEDMRDHVGIILVLAAITIYVLSDDLSLRPRIH